MAEPAASKGRYYRMRKRWGKIFVAPAVVFLLLFMLVPIVSVFALSFTSWDGMSSINFIGISNFTDIFADQNFWQVIKNNFIFMFIGTPVWTITPLIVAALLYSGIKGAGFFRSTFLFPTVLATSVLGIVFKSFFGLNGPMNALFKAMGLDFLAINWLGSGTTSIPLIIMIINWAGFGSATLIFLAGMSSIEPSVYESALLDGAGWWTRFFKITLPMIFNVTMFVIILNVIASFTSLFNYVFTMTNGGPGYETTVMEYLVYLKAFRSNQFGYACALSVILFVVIMVISTVLQSFNKRRDWMD